jgi:hypothetical protein
VRGSAFGVLAAVQSLGNLVASSVAGVLWTLLTPAAGFTYLAVCMVAATLVLRAQFARGRASPSTAKRGGVDLAGARSR